MAKEFAKAFYKSKAWRICRESYISKRRMVDGGMCERCKKELGYILHHRIKLTPMNIKDPYISLNYCNLEYVCKKCHDNEHYYDIYGEETKPRCIFDKDGQPIPRE